MEYSLFVSLHCDQKQTIKDKTNRSNKSKGHKGDEMNNYVVIRPEKYYVKNKMV